MSESFAQLFEESLSSVQMRPGHIIHGTVIDIRNDGVVVNAGLKSEGVIPLEQFRNARGELEVHVGDVVEVSLDAVEDGFGATRLSREKARRNRAWTELEAAFENTTTITGTITGRVKGGFTVDLGELQAFLPGSLVDIRPVRDPSYLEGKPLEFKVIKLDQKRNNIVVSRRAVVESEHSAEREALLDSLKEGQVIKGTVKNLTDYGAFIDLGGIDGLLHVTDMVWRRVKHPSEVVNIGDELEVKILKFDRERCRVSLGLKQLGEDPWSTLARRYPSGTRIFGRITNVTDYGCFVEIEDGVEGLVHVSEIDWTSKNINPARVCTVGDEVEVMILDIDEERRRISLGIKQCKSNPWEDFAADHNKGDKVSGIIKSITDFGIFIGLDGGIDGLIHASDISWNTPAEEAVRNFKKGDQLEAIILSVDPERERISLGVKQLERDPFANFLAENPKGSIVKGMVKEVDAKAATVSLMEGVEGILRASELSRDRVEDARSVLKAGDEVETKFIGVDRKSRTISLSIKAKEEAEEAVALQDYAKTGEATTSLGDLLKAQIRTGREG